MALIEERPVNAAAAGIAWPNDIHPVLRQVYSRRPIESIDDLDLRLSKLTPVGQYTALDAAVDLIVSHKDGKIVIVGDFDSDGATSTALMVLSLRAFGFSCVEFFVPDRFELGYGLSIGAVERVRGLQPSLLITVDNGISSVDGVAAARAAGLDVLITDHHLPPRSLPAANVIVDPNVPDQVFGRGNLSGVGVAFYLLAALGRRLGEPAKVADYLDLVALGTVADLVPLDRTNRILVHEGLRRLRAGRCRPGIRALCECARIGLDQLDAAALGFKLAPRLNAAGRLDDMAIGVRCLLSHSLDEARRYAAKLDELNRERRELESKMRAEAIEILDTAERVVAGQSKFATCIYRDDWHEGLVGLIASRIKDLYHRPTIAFARAAEGQLKGSGRSIPGFHLRDALATIDSRNPGLISRFGGHAMAAGLTLPAEALGAFRDAFDDIAQQLLEPDQLAKKVLTDGRLRADHFELDVAKMLRDGGPWGQGFPEPIFSGSFEVTETRWLKNAHLKMSLRHAGRDASLDAIAFNCEHTRIAPSQTIDVAFRLDVNNFFETPRLQLIIDHVET